LVEEKLPAGSPLLQAPLRDLPLPEKCVIAAVMRHGQVMIPRGDMHFEAGDEVLAVVDNASISKLRALFGNKV
jgi:trk system potassium uptake protein TrkA